MIEIESRFRNTPLPATSNFNYYLAYVREDNGDEIDLMDLNREMWEIMGGEKLWLRLPGNVTTLHRELLHPSILASCD